MNYNKNEIENCKSQTEDVKMKHGDCFFFVVDFFVCM